MLYLFCLAVEGPGISAKERKRKNTLQEISQKDKEGDREANARDSVYILQLPLIQVIRS